MGQAKQRGTFEQRREQAIARKEEKTRKMRELESRWPALKARNPIAMVVASAMIALAPGVIEP
jgi:hypothetical protein